MSKNHIFFIVILSLILSGCSRNNFVKREQSINNTITNGGVDNAASIFTDNKKLSNCYNKKSVLTNEYFLRYAKYAVVDTVLDTNVCIEYPVINGMKNLELESKVNAMLKENAISMYKDDFVEGLDLQIKTNVKLINNSIISVKYSGYGKYHDSQSVFDVVYATNINLLKGTLIDFRELFNSNFQSKLNRDIFFYNGFDKAQEGEVLVENSHEFGYVTADESIIVDMFNEYYNNVSNDKYYFNDDTLTLILHVTNGNSAILELSAKYDNLLDSIVRANKVWDDIIY